MSADLAAPADGPLSAAETARRAGDPPADATADCLAEWISAAHERSIEAILETARRVAIAHDRAKSRHHGAWREVVALLPFGDDAARLYPCIWPIFGQLSASKPEQVRSLPPSVGTLAQLAQLDKATVFDLLARGAISARMSRADAMSIYNGHQYGQCPCGACQERKASLARAAAVSTSPPPLSPVLVNVAAPSPPATAYPAPALVIPEPQESVLALLGAFAAGDHAAAAEAWRLADHWATAVELIRLLDAEVRAGGRTLAEYTRLLPSGSAS